MDIRDRLVAAVLALLCGACAQGPVQEAAGVQRMYVFNCGESRTTDVSRWSPGVNVGQPFEFIGEHLLDDGGRVPESDLLRGARADLCPGRRVGRDVGR